MIIDSNIEFFFFMLCDMIFLMWYNVILLIYMYERQSIRSSFAWKGLKS